MIDFDSVYICHGCMQTIAPGQVHICPSEPGVSHLGSGNGYLCSCGQWVPSGVYHACLSSSQYVYTPKTELLLLDIIRLLERIAAKIGT